MKQSQDLTSISHYNEIKSINLRALPAVEKKLTDGTIALALVKCKDALGISMPVHLIEMLKDDVVEVYGWDALEDILTAIKRGRQGEFGATYNQLNMIIIREWMRVVLEEKADKRTKLHENVKKETKINKPIENVDYQAYLDRERKAKTEEKKPLSQMQYEAMKHNYFKSKKD